jgi:hypothetical protein
MRLTSGLADWIILAWTLFVLIVYVGGYLFPAPIGVYTWNLGAVYAVVLIGGATASALRLVSSRSKAGSDDPSPTDKKRAEKRNK